MKIIAEEDEEEVVKIKPITSGKCKTAVHDLGHYAVEISAPHSKCTALKCTGFKHTNRSM